MTCLVTPLPPIKKADEIRAILDLKARGWHYTEICEFLDISIGTYYNRLKAVARLKAELAQETDPCDD